VRAMLAYRFYFLESDGHIIGPPTISECEDDQAAIATAKTLLHRKAIEIWEQARLISRLDPPRGAA
jgi:hypothetical protein